MTFLVQKSMCTLQKEKRRKTHGMKANNAEKVGDKNKQKR